VSMATSCRWTGSKTSPCSARRRSDQLVETTQLPMETADCIAERPSGSNQSGAFRSEQFPARRALVDQRVVAQPGPLQVDRQHTSVQLARALRAADHAGLLDIAEDGHVPRPVSRQRGNAVQ
jgi:hypothetical protein